MSHPHQPIRRRARRTASKLGHHLDRFRSYAHYSSYAHCTNRGCGLMVVVDEDGARGNILEVECHAVTFG